MSEVVKVPRKIRIQAYKRDLSYGVVPTQLTELPEWVEDLISKVPAEYRDIAEVEIESDYDSSDCYLTIEYVRQETDEEEADRIMREQAREDAGKLAELKTLAALQKKYGVTQ